METNYAAMCGCFNITSDIISDELKNYLDLKQKQFILEIISQTNDSYIIYKTLDFKLCDLLKTNIDKKVPYSQFNDYVLHVENNDVYINWNLCTPKMQRFHFHYNLPIGEYNENNN